MAGFISCLDVSSQRLSEKSDQPPQVGRCRGEGGDFGIWTSHCFSLMKPSSLKSLGVFYTHIQWCFETIFSVAFFSARLPLPASQFIPKSMRAHRNRSGCSSKRTVPDDTVSTRFLSSAVLLVSCCTCPFWSSSFPASAVVRQAFILKY